MLIKIEDEPKKEGITNYLKRTWRVWFLITLVSLSLTLSFWLGAGHACRKGGGLLYKGGCYQTNVIDTIEFCEKQGNQIITCSQYVAAIEDTVETNITFGVI